MKSYLVFVPHLSKTYANGAARWLSPDKALVQLSIRNRHEDIFWFTLLHECAHILQNRKKHQFIDLDGDARSEEEIQADRFAAKHLIPTPAYRAFLNRGNSKMSRARVNTFASEIGVSAATVVGRLQHDELLPPSHLNDLRKKLEWVAKD